MRRDAHYHTCASCGGVEVYHTKEAMLRCLFCHTTTPIVKEKEVTYHPLEEAQEDLVLERSHEVSCMKCGASFSVEASHFSLACPYCKTPLLLEPTHPLKPDRVLPFRVSKEDAQKAFKRWVGSLWFAPSALSDSLKGEGKLKGCYVPHLVFRFKTHTRYSGERGEAYYVTVRRRVTDANGRSKEIEVQQRRIRWYPTHGEVRGSFRDLCVSASKEVNRQRVEALEPWSVGGAYDFNDAFLSGFEASEYTLSLSESFTYAKQKSQSSIERAIRADIGGDEQRIHSKKTTYLQPAYLYVLFPLWRASFVWKKESYEYMVHGVTAKVSGERPYSWLKITSTLITLTLLAGGAYYLWQG